MSQSGSNKVRNRVCHQGTGNPAKWESAYDSRNSVENSHRGKLLDLVSADPIKFAKHLGWSIGRTKGHARHGSVELTAWNTFCGLLFGYKQHEKHVSSVACYRNPNGLTDFSGWVAKQMVSSTTKSKLAMKRFIPYVLADNSSSRTFALERHGETPVPFAVDQDLQRRFPEEKEAIERYVDLVVKCNKSADLHFFGKLFPRFLQRFLGVV